MTTINVSLPEPMREWVEAQIRGGRYGNLSEYVRDLIRRDQEREAEARLERLLLEGVEQLDSGMGIDITPEFWERKRQALLRRGRRKTSRKNKNRK